MAQVHDEWCLAQFYAPPNPCSCPEESQVPDGRDPAAIEHLCARDLSVQDGPVEDCCIGMWRDEGVRIE